jgi:transposase-like protein
MSLSNGRRKWTASEKLRIVLAGMQTGDIAELCRREGINPTQYYGWKNQLLQSADAIFDVRSQKPSRKEARMERDTRRMQAVIAEITAENLDLKKTLLD